jgi:transcriptional regulator with XRE-family HTH domain
MYPERDLNKRTLNLTDMIAMKLDKVLKSKLQKRGVKITQLSKATKVPLQTLHNWLSGQKPRDIDQVKRVADYFGVSINSLCFDEIEKTSRDLKDFKEEILVGNFEVILRRPKGD